MNPITAVMAVALLAAVIKKVTDFPSQIRAHDLNAVAKQSLAWVLGVGGAFLLAHSDWGTGVQVTEGVSLATAAPATLVIFGFAVASGASVAFNDVLGAIDNTRSSVVPPLTFTPATPGSAGVTDPPKS